MPVGARYWDEPTSAFEKAQLNAEEPQPALNPARDNTMSHLGSFCPIA